MADAVAQLAVGADGGLATHLVVEVVDAVAAAADLRDRVRNCDAVERIGGGWSAGAGAGGIVGGATGAPFGWRNYLREGFEICIILGIRNSVFSTTNLGNAGQMRAQRLDVGNVVGGILEFGQRRAEGHDLRRWWDGRTAGGNVLAVGGCSLATTIHFQRVCGILASCCSRDLLLLLGSFSDTFDNRH